MASTPDLLDSITDATPANAGRIVVSGSHGGLYPAALASQAGIRAVIFNDAGVGLEDAGVQGVRALASVGMAAAAVDCMSCRIGFAAEMLAEGRISTANAVARSLGLEPGMPVSAAVDVLAGAAAPNDKLPPVAETRTEILVDGLDVPVLLLDSASLVRPEDAGRIVITGSHGGLIGGDPARALKAAARLAVFNDAGFGKDRYAVSRIAALEDQGIAAAAVAHTSARIGDARSALATGVISTANAHAREMGLAVGDALKDALVRLHAQ